MAVEATHFLVQNTGEITGIVGEVNLKELAEKLLNPRDNAIVRVGQVVISGASIAAVIKKENAENKNDNIHMVVARANVYMTVDDPQAMLDLIVKEANTKQFVLLADAALFNKASLAVAQHVLV